MDIKEVLSQDQLRQVKRKFDVELLGVRNSPYVRYRGWKAATDIQNIGSVLRFLDNEGMAVTVFMGDATVVVEEVKE